MMRMLSVWFLLVALAAPVSAGALVQFRTPLGDIEVELFEDKPVTTRNFIRYVESGAYREMFLHRWKPGFVIQGGGFRVGNGPDGPQFFAVPTFGTITNEFDVGRRRSNTYGTIAMAKTGEGPNTASSQWFFNLADNSANLDAQNGGFTVFGRIVRGTNVLNRFNNISQTNGIYVVRLDPPLDDLPVLSASPTLSDMVFADITLLKVKVERTSGGGREVSWNSVGGRPNHVEYTTNLPPVWNTLISTNGTGETLKVVDGSSESDRRFYRVRVEY